MAKPDEHEHQYDCGYNLVEDAPSYPSVAEEHVANREHMRWRCEDALEMDQQGGIEPETGEYEDKEDIAGESAHEESDEDEQEDAE